MATDVDPDQSYAEYSTAIPRITDFSTLTVLAEQILLDLRLTEVHASVLLAAIVRHERELRRALGLD